MQDTIDTQAVGAVAGMLADTGNTDVLSGHNQAVKGYLVSVDSVDNSTEYEIEVNYKSRAASTFGQAAATAYDITSDVSATKAEIVAALVADINGDGSLVQASALTSEGPILVTAAQPAFDFTLELSANLSATLEKGEIPFGVLVVESSDRHVRLPFTEDDVAKPYGIAVRSLALENTEDGEAKYPHGSVINALRSGRIHALVEGSITKDGDVFVRHTPNGSNDQRGAMRADRDGVAQVDTITPTAVNSATYNLSIDGRAFAMTADGSATAAEIVTAFTALINADTDAPVVASGTSTLILTAKSAGVPFHTSVGANLSRAATTDNVARAAKLAGAKFKSSAVNGCALVQLSLA